MTNYLLFCKTELHRGFFFHYARFRMVSVYHYQDCERRKTQDAFDVTALIPTNCTFVWIFLWIKNRNMVHVMLFLYYISLLDNKNLTKIKENYCRYGASKCRMNFLIVHIACYHILVQHKIISKIIDGNRKVHMHCHCSMALVCLSWRKIEKVPRGIQGEKSGNDTASSEKTCINWKSINRQMEQSTQRRRRFFLFCCRM